MAHRMNISKTIHVSDARFIRDNPAQDHVNCGARISDGCGRALRRRSFDGEGDDGSTADAFNDSVGEARVGVVRDLIEIGADQLKLDRRTATVEYEYIHRLTIKATSSRESPACRRRVRGYTACARGACLASVV